MKKARSLFAAGAVSVSALAGLGAADANAQQVYRIVGPDGKVTFSDQPPINPATRASAAKTVALPAGGGTEVAALPFALRQAATRYPVVLYTAPDCGPCGIGRSMLSGRGIPFSEKTVTSREDIDAFKRMGATSLPFLTIGGQQITGYAEPEWVQFLDAAGYPATSQLPAGYVRRPASPLVAAQEAQAVRAPAPAAQSPNAAAAPAPAPAENPAGIKF
jgi:glutaredoxin